MKRTKVFFVSFTITFCIMLICYMTLYWFVGWSAEESVGKNQQGVPVLSLTPEDTKTILMVLDGTDAQFYFLLQLNAIQNKVNFVSVPAAYYLSQPQRTLGQSMSYAGVRQCVQDLSSQFDINIDYYLVSDIPRLAKLVASFGDIDTNGVDIPQSVKMYLLKGAGSVSAATLMDAVGLSPALLDNGVGIEFLNIAGDYLLRHNIEKLETAADTVKENYRSLNTDMNTQDLEQIKRIVRLLAENPVEYSRLVMDDTENTAQKLEILLKE